MRRVDGDLAGPVGSIGELTLDAETGRLRVDAGSGGSIPNPLPVTGPVTNAQLTAVTGAASAAAYTDVTGAASGTIIALLKGIVILLNDIKTNTTPTP